MENNNDDKKEIERFYGGNWSNKNPCNGLQVTLSLIKPEQDIDGFIIRDRVERVIKEFEADINEFYSIWFKRYEIFPIIKRVYD